MRYVPSPMEQRLLNAWDSIGPRGAAETRAEPLVLLTSSPTLDGELSATKRRPHYAVPLSPGEGRDIARTILPILPAYTSRYDEAKYPPDQYVRLRERFGEPGGVRPEDLLLALRWKYGHSGKARIPAHHHRLATVIAGRWPALAADLPLTPAQTFAHLDRAIGGKTRFITVAFLTHLMFPNLAPIIDQHNFRAMNHLMAGVRPLWPMLSKPTAYVDIAFLRRFMAAVLDAWPDAGSRPATTHLDRFLMMYGKERKSHRSAGPPPAAGTTDRP